MIRLETASAYLGVDEDSGRLVSFRPHAAPEQEFIASAREHPAFVVLAYEPGGAPNGEAILLPRGHGGWLLKDPRPEMLGPDHPRAWRMAPPHHAHEHYPGVIFAQLMAYYNRCAGVYLACEDAEGHVKLLKALHRDPGIRLGVAHVGELGIVLVVEDAHVHFAMRFPDIPHPWKDLSQLYGRGGNTDIHTSSCLFRS